MDIKENVKFILKERGMTQQQLADKLGMSLRTVQYYLNGNLTVKVLQKLADAMDTTVATIVSEEPLFMVSAPVPTSTKATLSTLKCPNCGKELIILAKG